MSDPQDRIAQTWNEAIDRHVASLSEAEFAAMVSRTRSDTFGAKVSQLWDITQRVGASGQGYTAGIADAAAARGPGWQPPPELTQQPQRPGFAPNRGQDHSGSGTDPAPQQPPTRLH
jgi:hypothetical protein